MATSHWFARAAADDTSHTHPSSTPSPRPGAPRAPGARRSRRALAAGAAALLVTAGGLSALGVGAAQAAVPGTAPGVVNEPPTGSHSIIAFPQRDFVSASGFAEGHTYTVDVVHPSGVVVTTGSGLVPQDDPRTVGFDGLVEVNHPGGYCWVGVTPDIRPGDKVRVIDDADGVTDQTTVANVTAGRPVQTAPDTVVVHGTAAQADGSQIPVAELEQRLVANRQVFLASGSRTLRAASVAPAKGGGLLTYDSATGNAWTATYTGLAAADVTMALGAESRALWLGRAIAPAVESTVFENGAGIVAGPAAPCTAPLEKLPPPPGSDMTAPSAPSSVTATVTDNNTVTLTWAASSDNVGVVDYGIFRDGTAIATVQNADGTAPAPTTFVDKNVPPGTYTYTVDAGDAAGNRSVQSPGADATTTAAPAPVVPVNEPPASPVSIISFPSRDFVSPAGFEPTDLVNIYVIRSGKVISSATGQVPQDDERTPGFDGLVEVNHPGGGCWEGITPELRAGDVVRTVAYSGGVVRTIDQTRTSDVTATKVSIVKPATTATSRDGVVEIHGTAVGPDGKPIALANVEQRLVANRDAFDLTAKRTLRAPGSGTMTYDTTGNPTGEKWTATYSGLSSDDVYRAAGGTSLTGRTFAGAESRVLWLGANPLSGQELTIFELGLGNAPGPVAGLCTAPLERPDSAAPSTPTGLTATQTGASDVALSWTASTDDWYVAGYQVLDNGVPIARIGGSFGTAGDSTSTFTVPTSYALTNVAAGAHSFTVEALDNASPLGPGATDVEKVGAGIGNPYGNLSAPSNAAAVTQQDVTKPTVPGGVSVKVTGSDVAVTWTASTDDVGVTGYRVYRDGVQVADVAATATSYTDTGVAPGTYGYTVDATDAAANRSAQSAPPATATVTPAPDTTPPSEVPGLKAGNNPDIHGSNVLVQWGAATDAVGVSGYGVYRNGTKVADVNAPSLSYLDVNLPAGTYAYTVDAVDSAGNRSLTKPAPVSVVVANDPPAAGHDIIGFPARDFISATGYRPNTPYTFALIHPDGTTFASTTVSSDATGTVEVNHPGGACWVGRTPNMRPGDVIRVTDPATGVAEQTTVSDVTAERPFVTAVDPVTGGGTVEVHGTAQDAAGKQLPLGQVEQRLIANRDAFDLNGRRTLRAPGDGTLAYDSATSVRWTARYTVQTPNDLARAVGGTSTSGQAFVGAESRALWLGRTPLAANEQTIFENGAGVVGGPAGLPGCTDVAETPAPGAALSAAPTFADTAVGSTSAAQSVTLTNNGTAPLTVSKAYLAGLNPGDFVKGVDNATGATVAPGASVTVQVSFKPAATGVRQAYLAFADDAANTTDQAVVLSAQTPVAAAPTATAPVQSLAGSTLTVKPVLADSTIPVDLRWSGNGASRYELQMATGNGPSTLGAFTAVPITSTATSTTVGLRMGSTTGVGYQFQVRACNATTCGAWATGPKFTLVAADDSAITGFKGTWTAENLTGAYGGGVRWAAGSATATLVQTSFTVSGNAAWVSTLGPDRGLAQVQVDGGTPQVVDLYATTVQPARVVWARDALPVGSHTVTVTVLGKKSTLNPAACSTGTKCARVDVDAAVMIR
ncbi:MAG: choice-of-anchor D domain-containing protein [Dermatophilaceae bacterium]|nr:choice-of-anchor D domain-containing protein [Dermatophilaceae bacterium]